MKRPTPACLQTNFLGPDSLASFTLLAHRCSFEYRSCPQDPSFFQVQVSMFCCYHQDSPRFELSNTSSSYVLDSNSPPSCREPHTRDAYFLSPNTTVPSMLSGSYHICELAGYISHAPVRLPGSIVPLSCFLISGEFILPNSVRPWKIWMRMALSMRCTAFHTAICS